MSFYINRPIAHRGLHNEELPENSMASFEAAIQSGYSIELDVHLSKDEVPVVFHDYSLERMTGSKGDVAQYVLASLKKLKLLESDQAIPTLQEVIDQVGGRTPIIIELKNKAFDGVMEEKISEVLEGYMGDYTIQSFNPQSLKWFRQRFPATVIGLLVTSDLSGKSLGIIKRILLQYMSFLPVVRPDYIGLDYENFNIAQYLIIKKLTFGRIIFWTIKDEDVYDECKEFGDNIIFEGFLPKV